MPRNSRARRDARRPGADDADVVLPCRRLAELVGVDEHASGLGRGAGAAVSEGFLPQAGPVGVDRPEPALRRAGEVGDVARAARRRYRVA